MILTVRRARDGGKFAADERERARLLKKLSPGGFAFLDLEADFDAPDLVDGFVASGGRVIRSLHDFQGVPTDLEATVRRLGRGPTEIPKAAVTPKSSADFLRILRAGEALRGVEKVLLGMGDFGFPTRILAQRLGSLFSYSTPASAHTAAPGHVDPVVLDELYRYRRIGPSTGIFGVMGNPVMHSFSPTIHNRGFAELGQDAVYLPFLVDEISSFLEAADILSIRGLSVTVPHKEAVLAALGRRDNVVQAVGACNTMYRDPGGAWAGANTDGIGFLAPLRAAFGGTLPRGLGATVIGAGGAARAVVSALVGAGAAVLVLNRTLDKARALADAFHADAGPLGPSGAGLLEGHRDLIVQTTSAGMAPQADVDPFPDCRFTGKEVVYDLVYAPPTTAFLERALQAGCRVIRGRQMLLSQAYAQFRIFTGHDFPEAVKTELESETD